MTELVRNCAGGIVFCHDKVFLLKSDKNEWLMPKGVIRDGNHSNEIALWRVEDEGGIQAEIIGVAGNTCYRFFSETRQRDVINRIQWFAMRAENEDFTVSFDQGFLDGKYFPIADARERLTHDMDREVLDRAVEIYRKVSATDC